MSSSIRDDINSAIEPLEEDIKQHLRNRSSTEQLLLEVKCTNCLQRLIDIVNTHILRNFSLKLEMEYYDSGKCHDNCIRDEV